MKRTRKLTIVFDVTEMSARELANFQRTLRTQDVEDAHNNGYPPATVLAMTVTTVTKEPS